MRINDPRGLAGELVFVATAAGVPARPAAAAGLRSAMARAAQLLELEAGRLDADAAHDAALATRIRPAKPARRRTRRYAERRSLATAR